MFETLDFNRNVLVVGDLVTISSPKFNFGLGGGLGIIIQKDSLIGKFHIYNLRIFWMQKPSSKSKFPSSFFINNFDYYSGKTLLKI